VRILATILFFALTGYLSAQTGNNPTAAPTPFNPFPTDPITGRLLPLPMFSGSVREATQTKDARVQEAEAKAIPDQEAAALNSRTRQEFQAQMVAADERWCANHPVECAEKKAREAREEAIRNEARMQAEQMARDDAQRAERRDRDDAQRLVDDMQRNISSGHSRD